MLYFATYFDKNYLSRGLVLYDSLKKFTSAFQLHILCLDQFTYSYFTEHKNKYPEVKPFLLAELEDDDRELKASKWNRNLIEYYFTISPCLPMYLMKKYNLPHICLLDADILFLDDPKSLFDYLEDYSIIITPHKFSPEIQHLVRFGIYNVSFQVFKNDATAIVCLKKWRSQCIEWCSDVFDEANQRYADQKYLDDWTERYPGKVKELYDNVSGLAPWNLNNYSITQQDGNFYSNGARIIFYHFHHFKIFGKSWASNGLINYKVRITPDIDHLYNLYWNLIEEKNKMLGTSKDVIHRSQLPSTSNILLKLLHEENVYYKYADGVRHVSFKRVPKIVKKIIFKIYG